MVVIESECGVVKTGGELRLTPYRNFNGEGQITSDDIIAENLEDTPQPVYITLISTNDSTISLKDISVLQNDFGEEKAAFAHFVNTKTGEKTLLCNIGETIQAGTLDAGETVIFKIRGELNVNADWIEGDSLSMNIDIRVGEDSAETESESTEAETEASTETESGEDVSADDSAKTEADSSEENKEDDSDRSGGGSSQKSEALKEDDGIDDREDEASDKDSEDTNEAEESEKPEESDIDENESAENPENEEDGQDAAEDTDGSDDLGNDDFYDEPDDSGNDDFYDEPDDSEDWGSDDDN